MKLHLNHQPKKAVDTISHGKSSFFIGSCFSEHIHNFFLRSGLTSYSNHFGNLFNPLSIFSEIEALANQAEIDSKMHVQRNNRWYSLLAHSQLSAPSATELELLLKQKRKQALTQLQQADFVFITLGTAWYYLHKDICTIVANCQKLPQHLFEKKLAGIADLASAANSALTKLKAVNPKAKIVFTISPVRHLRDGVEENFLSKSILRCAVQQICSEFAHCTYFSAYELVNDDLKDYRFYEADLAHPNAAAISYVEEKFSETFFSAETNDLAKLYQKKNALLSHRTITDDALGLQQQNEALLKLELLIEEKLSKNAIH